MISFKEQQKTNAITHICRARLTVILEIVVIGGFMRWTTAILPSVFGRFATVHTGAIMARFIMIRRARREVFVAHRTMIPMGVGMRPYKCRPEMVIGLAAQMFQSNSK